MSFLVYSKSRYERADDKRHHVRLVHILQSKTMSEVFRR